MIDTRRPFSYDARMLSRLNPLVYVNLVAIMRDRVLHALFVVALAILLLVPSLSTFSMQQVQELAITLSLSGISITLMLTALLLGSSSIFRDVDRRFTASVLTLPVSRASYLVAKFISIALFLGVVGIVLGLCTALVIWLVTQQYPSELPVLWGNFCLAIAADILKYLMLSSLALLFSSISTSFFLPFFGTLAIFFCGSASQEVFEFVSGEFGHRMGGLSLYLVKAAYYFLPNFSAFNFNVHAIYALPVGLSEILYPLIYGILYTALLLGLAVWSFNRRQFA